MKESGIFDITSKLPLLKNITKKSEGYKSAFDDVQDFRVEYLDPSTGEATAEQSEEISTAVISEESLAESKPEILPDVQATPAESVPANRDESEQEADSIEVHESGRFPVIRKIGDVLRILFVAAYRLRAVFLAIPVILLALRLAAYNSEHLPLLVGLDLQSNGEFAKTISRQTAVTMPLFLTGGCLVLTCFSRKPMYPWLISLFSLAIPVLLLLTNMYPA